MNSEKKYGVFVGRMYPIHLGHEKIIKKMISECGIENCIVVVGSSNSGMSLRHFFSYEERRQFIKTLFPNIRVIGIPDYPKDSEWLMALDDLIGSTNIELGKAIFFGGSEIDIEFFLNDKRNIHIVDRYAEDMPRISATEVRDALIHGKPLEKLINQKIKADVLEVFEKRWEDFKKI